MYQFHEELARAHMSERLDEARSQRRGQQIALARRKARKAERASMQARLVLLRSL
jgi:hypothetical protein